MRQLSVVTLATFVGCWLLLGIGSQADEPKLDSRLEEKVTVTAVAAPLVDVLAELSQRTGILLDVHQNLKNQKVTVLLDDQPLRVVMNNLRDLLDGLWFTEKVKGKTGYYLKQKYGWQLEASRLRTSREDERRRKEDESRNRARETARVASLPRNELLAILDTDPRSVVDSLSYGWAEGGLPLTEGYTCFAPYGSGGLYGTAALIGQLSDAQLSLVFGGEELSISYNDLPAAGRVVIDQIVQILDAYPEHPFSGLDASLMNLHVYRFGDSIGIGLSREGRGALRLCLMGPGPRSGAWLPGVARVLGLTEGELQQRLQATDEGRALLAAPKQVERTPEEEGRWLSIHRPHKAGEAFDLGKLGDEDRSFEAVLDRVHQEAGLQVVADSYVVPKGKGLWRLGVPREPDYMIAEIAEQFGRSWTRDGDIYRMRSRTWYYDDALEPPVCLIKRLQAKVSLRNGIFESNFNVDDFVAAYGTLTDEQIQAMVLRENLASRRYYGLLAVAARGGAVAPTLRFYAALDPTQQQRVRTDGIGAKDLTPTQQAAFASCLDQVFKTELPPPQVAAAAMHLAVGVKDERRQSGERWIFTEAVFTFTLAGGDQANLRLQLASMPFVAAAKTFEP